MRNVCLLIFGVVTGVNALVTAYHVDPQTAAMSGKVSGNPEYGGISQVLTINFDEPITASLFCGSPGAGGSYNVDIYAYPGGVNPLAHGDTISPGDHKWATCTLYVDEPDSFIKGRQVEVRWTRGGSDSLQYYWSDGNPYKYGFMVTDQPHAGQDLAMRCLGRSNAGSEV